jgi:hypothetical protein
LCREEGSAVQHENTDEMGALSPTLPSEADLKWSVLGFATWLQHFLPSVISATCYLQNWYAQSRRSGNAPHFHVGTPELALSGVIHSFRRDDKHIVHVPLGEEVTTRRYIMLFQVFRAENSQTWSKPEITPIMEAGMLVQIISVSVISPHRGPIRVFKCSPSKMIGGRFHGLEALGEMILCAHVHVGTTQGCSQ